MSKVIYPDLETAMVSLRARWSVDFVQPALSDLVEIHGKDDLYHLLQRTDEGFVEICNSLSSIFNLFDNPSSVKSDLEAD